MGIEAFSSAHPIAYVHIAYAVVWVLHFGFVAWIALEWRRTSSVMTSLKKKATEPAGTSDSVVPRSHA